MKTSKLNRLLVLGVLIGTATFWYACQKEAPKEQNTPTVNRPSSSSQPAVDPKDIAAGTICCETECSRGTCRSYTSPCNCECDFSGFPHCTGGGGPRVDGQTQVSISSTQLDKFNNLIDYLNNLSNPYGDDIADKLEAMRNLFNAANNYVISSASEVNTYDQLRDEAVTMINSYLSPEEIANMP